VQELRQVGAILASDAGDQCSLGHGVNSGGLVAVESL